MNMLVTGGAGFLGSVICTQLLNDGHSVVVVDNFMYSLPSNVDKRAQILRLDVREKTTWKELEKINFDIVYHFASPSSIILFKENFGDCMNNTIQGFVNALDFCKRTDTRLVYPSTGSLYAGVNEQHENAQLNLSELNSYARGKLALEHIVYAYKDDVDVMTFRIFASYGENEKHKGDFASVIYLFAKDILNDKKPVIWGDGTQTRDFIYQNDVAKYITSLSYTNSNLLLNIGSGLSISFNDIIDIINIIARTDVKPLYVSKPTNYLESTCADIRLLKEKSIDYEAASFFNGVQRMIEGMNA